MELLNTKTSRSFGATGRLWRSWSYVLRVPNASRGPGAHFARIEDLNSSCHICSSLSKCRVNALFVQLMFCLQDIMDMAAYRSAMVFRLDPGEHKRSKSKKDV